MSRTDSGREQLVRWAAAQPDNFFLADANLQWVLRRYMGDAAYEEARPEWEQLGADSATHIDQAARTEDQIGNHPRLERWSNLGERLEQIAFHPNHELIGKLVWRSGIMALQASPGQTLRQMGLYYVLSHNGEAGHLCSLACTSGLIRVLQQIADPELRETFLPPLLDPNYDTMQHGAQFLTEVQGGSDVGANTVTATLQGDGWRINGEKWFCSNINADQFLMTARATSADGTRGLGLFLVPRQLPDGQTNGFHIRRLKDKLGTRTLASAELDFRDALAYPVGPLDMGFRHTVELVLNTSRLMNAVACAGVIHRAYLEAAQYACHREAFGTTIANFPMVQEAVADILSEAYAATSSSFYIASLLDRIETQQADADELALYRFLVNINKYITSLRGSEMVHRSIEVLGGNGAIESFSILPRLYRDMVVLESWEGTHNVLAVQVLRDIMRYQIHRPFVQAVQQMLNDLEQPGLNESRALIQTALSEWESMVELVTSRGGAYAEAHARRLIEKAAHISQAALMLSEAAWEIAQDLPTAKPDILDYFINRRLRPAYDPLADEDYLKQIERLMMRI